MVVSSTSTSNERFDVHLNATYGINGPDLQHQECRIVNLSSSGAKVRFPCTESFTNGDIIAVNIPLPNTIMRITTVAEVMWTKQRFNELISGIRFKRELSDTILNQVVNNILQLSDYTELIW
jgi:hypothetical protein